MNGKTIFHLDMDQFFAAVEIRHHPDLRGKPVIVGGSANGRGIVTTCTYEARKYGVHSGMASAEAIRLCPQAIFVRPDHAKYMDVSRHVFQMLLEFTERVEPVSVDEAYLDVTDVVWKEGGVEALAMKIKRRIKEAEGCTATIGAGPNRLVAKVACGMHKPDGFTYIPAERVLATFHDLPVGDLYGVGKSTQRVLESFGIRTAGQLAEFPVDILRRRFGKFGDELHHKARGEGSDAILVEDQRPQERSMGHDTTFSRDLTTAEELLGRLHHLSERLARRIRSADMAGCVVNVKIRYKGFETVLHGCKVKRHVQHEVDIFPIAEKLFHESWRVGEPVRLIGIHISGLIPTGEILQQELFVAAAETDDLSKACDELKDRYGEHVIGYASGVFNSGDRARNRNKRVSNYNPFHFNPLAR